MNQTPAIIECDKCGREVARSKTIYDQGANHPKLAEKMRKEGKDHLMLCPDCAGIEIQETDEENSKSSKLDETLSNIRKFL